MALDYTFIDGFDHYSKTEFSEKWNAATSAGNFVSGSDTRFNVGQAYTGGGVTSGHTISTAHRYWLVACAFRTSANNGMIMAVDDAGSEQVVIGVDASNKVQIKLGTFGGGTNIGTAGGTVNLNTWHHLALAVFIDNSAGHVIGWLDGVNVTEATSVDTQNSANNDADGFEIAASTAVNVDDFYAMKGDSTSGLEAEFPGDLWVSTVYPNGVGDKSEWTASATGDNYEQVDEQPPASDAVEGATAGDIDLYEFQNLSADVGAILATQHNASAFFKSGTSGPQTVGEIVKSDGTEYTGTEHSIASTASMYRHIRTTDPATGLQWTKTGFNAAQHGVKKVL